jgi:hypothetical protein
MRITYKNIAISGFVTLLSFSFMLYASCKKQADNTTTGICANVVCYNDGRCVEGKCNCVPGFEGAQCETDSRARYLGSWEVTETIKGSSKASNLNQTKNYTLTIQKSNVSKIALRFGNLSGVGVYNNIIAYVGRKYDVPAHDYYIDITTNFCFAIEQAISGTSTVINGGNGYINNLSTYISGTYYLQYPDNGKTVLDTVSFSADHL